MDKRAKRIHEKNLKRNIKRKHLRVSGEQTSRADKYRGKATGKVNAAGSNPATRASWHSPFEGFREDKSTTKALRHRYKQHLA